MSELDRLRIRRSDLERLLEASGGPLTKDEHAIRSRLAEERALDLGIPDLPHYGPLFDELTRAPFGRRFERALWHPEGLVQRRWPLNSTELAQLLAAVNEKVACSFQTIDRLAKEELIAAPLEIGLGEERALRVYFGRHFVEVAYWQYRQFRPETERARLEGLRAEFANSEHAQELYWSEHPSVPGGTVLRRVG